LLNAVAARLTELDVADLSLMAELAEAPSTEFAGSAGLARIVMYVAKEPWLTRAKARYELLLLAGRDPELAQTLNETSDRMHALARAVVAQWRPAGLSARTAPDPALAEDQAIATMALINGVMMTFVAGRPVVDNPEHLDRLIQGVIAGVAHVRPDAGSG
jgi:hypothetical protein